MKFCRQCGGAFEPNHPSKVFCRKSCRSAWNTKRYGVESQAARFGLSPPTVGALNELRVCVDLIERGYHVFRAVSPACPSDLIAYKDDGAPIRIQVKTAYKRDGKLVGVRSKTTGYDVMGIATIDEILYAPALDTIRRA